MFSTLFLPLTLFLFEPTRPSRDTASITSRDRPQHPFLETLTSSPLSTLTCICLGVVVLHGWWGGWVRDWWIDYALKGSYDGQRLDRFALEKRKFSALRNAWAMTLSASLALHIIFLLFGAPLLSYHFHTYLLALLVSLLVVFTPAYCLGLPTFGSDSQAVVNRMTWVRLFAEFSIRTSVERTIVYPVVGTALGCWLGIVPIALDWDRPWQAWPLTPAFSAIAGYMVASLSALTANAIRPLPDQHIRSLSQAKLKTS